MYHAFLPGIAEAHESQVGLTSLRPWLGRDRNARRTTFNPDTVIFSHRAGPAGQALINMGFGDNAERVCRRAITCARARLASLPFPHHRALRPGRPKVGWLVIVDSIQKLSRLQTPDGWRPE